MARKKASQLLEQAESRRRFAAAAAEAQQSATQPTAQVQTSSTAIAITPAASAPPSGSSLPPNWTLSAAAVKLFDHTYEICTRPEIGPSSPDGLAGLIVAWEKLYDKVTDEILRQNPEIPPIDLMPEISLIQAIMELEDAPMDSLSPKMQSIKLGFEQVSVDPAKPKGIERRVNEALRVAGEPPMQIWFSDWKLDRSTIPPTRVVKTEQDRVASAVEHEKRLNDLKKRKPKLYATVQIILAETAAFMPTTIRITSDRLPDGSESLRIPLSNRIDFYGYDDGGPPQD